MKKLTKKLEKQISQLVQKHYAALNKKHHWRFGAVPCVGFSSFDYHRKGFGFDIHEGGPGEKYRWIDDADVLLPKLKKLVGAAHITVGVLGDLSNAGGIHISLYEEEK